MEKKYVLFDLDGTLTDSYEGIVNSLKYCLAKFNTEARPDTFRKIIGPPVTWSLKTFYGFDDERAMQALMYFREYYDTKGYLENRLYEGVEDMLKVLRAHDKKLMLATSKPEIMAERVLEHFGISDYFCFIAGSNAEAQYDHTAAPVINTELRSSKEDVIAYVLKTNGIFDPENAVMVGDRVWDVKAGKLLGLQTIGAGYGYAEPGELNEAGADFIADTTTRIAEIIVQQ